MVNARLERFVEKYDILDDEQSGFRRMFSCESAIQGSLIDWREYLDKGFNVGIVFVDFMRAFETIDRIRLIEILRKLGLRGTVIQWFESYLSGRRQRVRYKNKMSEDINVENGVPQGSKLGPILFSIYINEIISILKKDGVICKLSADDTKIYYASKNLNDIETVINRSLHVLSLWLKKHQLKINLKKTVFMLIHDSKRNNVRNKCKIKMGDVQIEEVRNTKYLGVIIDDNLTFNGNALKTINKLAKKLNVIY